jgi:phosphatidylglycerol:prolipoprotein diacylglycerol transferase
MLPILFRIPYLNIPIYSYGLMLVVAFFVCVEVARALARYSPINPDLFVNCGLIALASGLAGARISHILENVSDYTRSDLSVWQNLVNAVNLRAGGLTFYGGLILATFCCIAYGLYHKAPIRRGMDIVAPCVLIGLGIGRVGCLLNGCCYGARCDAGVVPWAITYPFGSQPYDDQLASGQIKLRDVPRDLLRVQPNAIEPVVPISAEKIRNDPRLTALAASQRSLPVQPAQIYSTISAFLLAGLLIAYYSLSPAPGRVFALMLFLEGINRFILELLRVEPPVWGRFSFSMIMGLLLSLTGIFLWLVFVPRKEQRGVEPVLMPGKA